MCNIPFKNVIIHTSQLNGKEVCEVLCLLYMNGGIFEDNINRKEITHLVCKSASGPKYEYAIKHRPNMKLVTPEWIFESVQQKTRLDEEEYHPRLLIGPIPAVATNPGPSTEPYNVPPSSVNTSLAPICPPASVNISLVPIYLPQDHIDGLQTPVNVYLLPVNYSSVPINVSLLPMNSTERIPNASRILLPYTGLKLSNNESIDVSLVPIDALQGPINEAEVPNVSTRPTNEPQVPIDVQQGRNGKTTPNKKLKVCSDVSLDKSINEAEVPNVSTRPTNEPQVPIDVQQGRNGKTTPNKKLKVCSDVSLDKSVNVLKLSTKKQSTNNSSKKRKKNAVEVLKEVKKVSKVLVPPAPSGISKLSSNDFQVRKDPVQLPKEPDNKLKVPLNLSQVFVNLSMLPMSGSQNSQDEIEKLIQESQKPSNELQVPQDVIKLIDESQKPNNELQGANDRSTTSRTIEFEDIPIRNYYLPGEFIAGVAFYNAPTPPRKPCILLSIFDEPAKEEMKVRQLGGTVASSWGDATHLVLAKEYRTLKFMCAISRVEYIVDGSWLVDSYEAGHFLPESQYAMKTLTTPGSPIVMGTRMKMGKSKVLCDVSAVLARGDARSRLFNGCTFYLTPNIIPSRLDLEEMIQAAGGKVKFIRRPQCGSEKHCGSLAIGDLADETDVDAHDDLACESSKMGPDAYYLITCHNDLDIGLVKYLLRNGYGAFDTEFVITSILSQKVDLSFFMSLSDVKSDAAKPENDRKLK